MAALNAVPVGLPGRCAKGSFASSPFTPRSVFLSLPPPPHSEATPLAAHAAGACAAPRSPSLRPSIQQCRAASGAGVSAKTRNEEWEEVKAVLKDKVRSISPAEAVALVQEGKYKILDVRTQKEFEDAHPEGAVNAQMFRLIKEWTPWDVLRRLGFAFFGVFNGTEDNPDFLDDVSKQVSKEEGVIVTCMLGGTLKPTTSFPAGRDSRSLKAAHMLVTNGYTNVLHMEGGLLSYFHEDHPVVEK